MITTGFYDDMMGKWTSEDTDLTRMLETLSSMDVLAVDTETTGLDPRKDDLVVVTIATSTAAIIWQAGIDDLMALVPLLENHKIVKVLQYAPFDYGFLYKHLGADMYPCYDTREAGAALGLLSGERSLKALAKRYLNHDLDKGPQTTFTRGTPLSYEQKRYAAIDALILHPILQAQALEIALYDARLGIPFQPTASTTAYKCRRMREYVDRGGEMPDLR